MKEVILKAIEKAAATGSAQMTKSKLMAEGGEAGKTNEYWKKRENLEIFLNLNDEDIYWKWVNGELTDSEAIELIKEMHGVELIIHI